MASETLANIIVVTPTFDEELASTTYKIIADQFIVICAHWYQYETSALRHLEIWAHRQLSPYSGAPQGQEILLLITEFDLYDMTCYEFLQKIRENPCSKYIHVIVMDSVYVEEKLRRCEGEGAHYNRKPMDSSKMESFIEEVSRVELERQVALSIGAQRQPSLRIDVQRREAHRIEAQRQLDSNKRKRKRCSNL